VPAVWSELLAPQVTLAEADHLVTWDRWATQVQLELRELRVLQDLLDSLGFVGQQGHQEREARLGLVGL